MIIYERLSEISIWKAVEPLLSAASVQVMCLKSRFPDVAPNLGPRRLLAAACRIHCCNELGLSKNLCYPTMALFQYDILLCSETLVSELCHISELLVTGFGLPVLLCGTVCLQPEDWPLEWHLCFQYLPQLWPRWPDLLLFININGCLACWGCACLVSVYGFPEWPSSGKAGFYLLWPRIDMALQHLTS